MSSAQAPKRPKKVHVIGGCVGCLGLLFVIGAAGGYVYYHDTAWRRFGDVVAETPTTSGQPINLVVQADDEHEYHLWFRADGPIVLPHDDRAPFLRGEMDAQCPGQAYPQGGPIEGGLVYRGENVFSCARAASDCSDPRDDEYTVHVEADTATGWVSLGRLCGFGGLRGSGPLTISGQLSYGGAGPGHVVVETRSTSRWIF